MVLSRVLKEAWAGGWLEMEVFLGVVFVCNNVILLPFTPCVAFFVLFCFVLSVSAKSRVARLTLHSNVCI